MKSTSSLCISTALVCGLALGTYTAGAAQKAAQAPMARHQTTSHTATTAKPKYSTTFRGVAKKLDMTPDAFASAYQTAKQANPKLTRGQFMSANMVAHNLGDKNSAITTDAILDGLKSGKSLGQTLQGLGLSATEAKEAERQADKDTRAAAKQAS